MDNKEKQIRELLATIEENYKTGALGYSLYKQLKSQAMSLL